MMFPKAFEFRGVLAFTTYTRCNEVTEAYRKSMGYTDGNILSRYSKKRNGFSARCLKN
tara:strand:- start:170 stop:343 length:174 start_codon:yes stop_codon:yes gene_type:complete